MYEVQFDKEQRLTYAIVMGILSGLLSVIGVFCLILDPTTLIISTIFILGGVGFGLYIIPKYLKSKITVYPGTKIIVNTGYKEKIIKFSEIKSYKIGIEISGGYVDTSSTHMVDLTQKHKVLKIYNEKNKKILTVNYGTQNFDRFYKDIKKHCRKKG